MPHRIGNIYPSIYNIENIKLGHKKARLDKSFYDAVKKTDADLDNRAQTISTMLKEHTYKPGKLKTSRYTDRGKSRILYKQPYYPDRIIQWSIMLQIEPSFQRLFTPFTCASLPGRGIQYASNLLDRYLQGDIEGTKYYLKIDIKKFYPSINQRILKKLLRKLFKDKDLLYELDNIIDSYANNDIEKLNLTKEEHAIYCRPGYGVPVGSYLSQYLANFYLAYFDHWLIEECKCKYVIRYMDDIIILSDSKEFLHNILCAIKFYLHDILDLEIKNNYSITPTTLGIDFVGYRHFYGYKLLRKSTKERFKRALIKAKETGISIDERQWCGCVSIMGGLGHCNSYDFAQKYLYPLIGPIGMYYLFYKKSSKRKTSQSFELWTKYLKNYKENNKYKIKQSHKLLHLKEGKVK